ncbi:hypothetical protein [Pseudanabaena sp. FACHB-1998]|uniref:hypothetical protein n=1 Tax=Pseudanabaena sp. FACHB-1998 TaxID=2692858 RepID=UPI0016819E59|nr:hypothetical protein [Pseudanabaena sp. FACHB-1998]
MMDSEQLNNIIERILERSHTKEDMAVLSRLLKDADREVKVQLAKYNINITDGENIHFGDRIYQSNDIEAIRKVLLEFLTEKTPVDPTVKTSLKKYESAASVSIYDSYARCREIDDECKKNLEKDRIRIGISLNESLITDQKILEKCQRSDQDLSNFLSEGKEIIINNLEINSNVAKKIMILSKRYDMTEKQASYLYHDMGLEFLDSGQDDMALDCFNQSIKLYKGAENYETYMSIYKIYLKSGKRREALEILKITKKKFVSFMSKEQITKHEKFINQLEQKKIIFF